MNYRKIGFSTLELVGFILPALPNSLSIRLLILSIYFIAHYFKLQVVYSTMKKKYIDESLDK